MRMTDKSCREFLNELADKTPVPGGGGASALAGAMGAALGHMVGEYTAGKKKYADVEEDIQELMGQARRIQDRLVELAERDAEVFAPLAAAYSMPTDTPEQKAEKDRVEQAALKEASLVPLQIMECCCRTIDLLDGFASKGSTVVVSDAGGGVIICKSALQAASLNVFINTRLMKDRDLAADLEARADEMLQEYTVKADEVYAGVFCSLRKQI
ncbi:MAG: cyclodeaminase/cyclohydrolase family protein [Emergencia sp.]